jgi:phospholipid transport system substrate-binding protein
MPNPARRDLLLRGAALMAGVGTLAGSMGVSTPSRAQSVTAPDALIRRITDEVIGIVKTDAEIQAGSLPKIKALVDARVLPHVNFQRMTAIAVGRAWRGASPEQRQRLMEEFKTLLLRTYAGALVQVKDQTVDFKPMRARADDTEVVVRTEIRGRGDPIQLDYRLEKAAEGWRIYDVNVLGVWLADTSFKSQFAPVVASGGIDALITSLAELNRRAGGGS